MRKLIFSMLAMAAWKWITSPSPKKPAPRTASTTPPRRAAAASSHADVKRSAPAKRKAATPKAKKADAKTA